MQFVRRSLVWQRGLVAFAVAASALGFSRSTLDVFNTFKATLIVIAAIAVAVAGVVRVSRTRRLVVPRTVLWWPLGAFAVALVAATVVSDTPWVAVVGRVGRHTGMAAYMVYAFIAITAVRLYRDHPPEGLVKVLLATAVPVTAYGLLQILGVDPLEWTLVEGGPPVFSTFGNSNFFSAWLGVVLPLAVLGTLRQTWPPALRASSAILAVVTFGVASASGSLQGPLAGLVGAAFVATVWVWTGDGPLRRWRWQVLGGGAALTVGGIGAVLVGAGPLAVLGDRAAASLSTRVGKWETALAMFADRPLLGFGLDGYLDYFHRYRPLDVAVEDGLIRTTDTPHNVPLEMLAGGGVVLFLAYIAVLAVSAWALARGLRRLEGDEQLLLAGLGGAWLAYQVQSMVSIDVPPLAVLHWVLAGTLVGLGTSPELREVTLPGAPAPVRVGKGRKATTSPGLVPASPVALGLTTVVVLGLLLAGTKPYRAEAAARDAAAAPGLDVAVEHYRRAADIAFWESRYHGQLGALLAGEGDAAAAVDAYQEALEREPRGLAHTINLGRTAHHAGQADVAEAAFSRLLELDPHTPEILVEVAGYRMEVAQAARAEELLSRAVALRGDNASWWTTLGQARSDQGDERGAEEAFTRARELEQADGGTEG